MAKGSHKSSATSGTRKKHAKKHNLPEENMSKEKRPKKERGKKELRQKTYIPPVKPPPIQPDPLETTGLAHTLPADLLVVLRSFNKKAQVTKIRALEDLQSSWVDKCQKGGEDGTLAFTLAEMLPVWMHHVSPLFLHPSRRVRMLTANLHASLLRIPVVRDQMFFFIRESASPLQVASILGSWCIAAHDADRAVSVAASRAWKDAINTTVNYLNLDDQLQASFVDFIQRTVLDPVGTYAYLNPSPPAIATAQPQPQSKKGAGRPTPAIIRRDDSGQASRTKVEEFEENDQDRKARLRVGALGTIVWILETNSEIPTNLAALFVNPAFWTCLHHSEMCPWIDIESFGFSQPNVRKAAWRLIQSLLATQKGRLDTVGSRLATPILRSAWVEQDTTVQATMWQPLLTFLKDFPTCWDLEYSESQETLEDSSSDDESDDGHPQTSSTPQQAPRPSLAYQEFLQFLQLGCSGSPLQGYPTVVISLSTIPSSIISASAPSPLDDFFTSFWATVDGRALSSLHRLTVSAAFLSSLLECIVFLLKRLRGDSYSKHGISDGQLFGTLGQGLQTVSRELVQGQIGKVWEEVSSGRLKVEERAMGRMLAQTLESLNDFDPELFKAAWDTVSSNVIQSEETHPVLVSALLKVFYDRFKDGTPFKDAANSLFTTVLNSALETLETGLGPQSEEINSKANIVLLVDLVEQFRSALFHLGGISDRIDGLLHYNAFTLLRRYPTLLLSVLSHQEDTEKTLGLWQALLSDITRHPDVVGEVLKPLLDAADRGGLPNYLKPEGNGLDELVRQLLVKALSPSAHSGDEVLVGEILRFSAYFLSENGLSTIFDSLSSSLKLQIDQILAGEVSSMASFETPLSLILTLYKNYMAILTPSQSLKALLPNAFLYCYLLPLCEGFTPQPSYSIARDLWREWYGSKSTTVESKFNIVVGVKKTLKSMITNTRTKAFPRDILQLLSEHTAELQVDVITEILPSESELDGILSSISSDPIDPSIGVVDPFIPPSSSGNKVFYPRYNDSHGFSRYARGVSAVLQVLIQDRAAAKRNVWALRHFLVFSGYAYDFQRIPSASSPVFDERALGVIESGSLIELILKVHQITAYLLRSGDADGAAWRTGALTSVSNGKVVVEPHFNQLSHFLVQVINHAKDDGDNARDTTVLRTVLQHVLEDVEVAEADSWVRLARKIERSAPETSMAIVASITRTGVEPSSLDRYRNECAASLLGIVPCKVNTEGLLMLRKLSASAPDPDSDVVFLPQLRALNLVKACQRWVQEGEDDDEAELGEEVESVLLLVFASLAPILQNASGSHWGFMFDVLETVVENSSITDDDTLVGLARALRMIIVLEDLTATNKALRAEWEGRRLNVLKMVQDLATVRLDNASVSLPRSTCRELILSIVRTLPPSLIDQDTVPKMCHLVTDPSADVQKMAYQILRIAAHKRTEHLVIEVGVGNIGSSEPEEGDGGTPKEEVEEVKEKYKDRKRRQKEREKGKDNRASLLPLELLQIVQRDVPLVFQAGNEEDEQNIFGWMLGWMLIFDLFQDASFKVKSMYIEQLRNLDVVGSRLIPSTIALLRLDEGLSKAFKVDLWAVDEYFVDLYEPSSVISIPVLGAHLYYRALLCVPSLIHTWVLDCKDRQLTTSLTAYTSQHFSPLIIRAELAHVRSAEGMAELVGDGMSVKVIGGAGSGGGNEVVAAYLVDDHQLEIKLKIPVDWPLHRIEVKDVKRVGVDENRWRAWVLGVQQTIWTHNGRIVDGLSLFKKNVTLHFEGQVECAICYSIISVMDGSLPKKPCKTCKNRFHAGCLYKWFNTSHSSSCPLCRSDII